MNIVTNGDSLLAVAKQPKYYIGLYITPKKGETVGECLERCTTFNLPAKYPVIDLVIKMPCGEEVSYKTLDDIPSVDTPCTCGNLEHHFIKIGEPL